MKAQIQSKKSWSYISILILAIISFGSLWGSAKSAQSSEETVVTQHIPELIILAGEPDEVVVRNRPPVEFIQKAPQTANITVTYEGAWDAQAQAAFEYAVGIWETQITSAIEIKVQAKWSNLGGGVLGSAGAAAVDINFPNAPVANSYYPIALANRLAGTDRFTTQEDCDDDPPVLIAGPDICASFNSAFPNWYFGTDGNPPGGQYDFASVVLHELGHGLGFFGSMTYGANCGGSNLGCWGYGFFTNPFIYDRFAENNAGTPLLSFPNNSVELGNQLISDNVFFNGPNANAGNGNVRVELYAPASWQQGSSYSHLGEVFNNTANALMTFSIGPGEVQHDPGPVTLGMFKDMGWNLSGPTPSPTKTATPTITLTPLPTIEGGTPLFMSIVRKDFTPTPTKTPTKTPTPTSANWVTIHNETFEGAFPGNAWQLFNFGSTSGYQWGKRNCQVFQGSFSGWGVGGGVNGSTLGCNANYPNNVETWSVYGPFSLEGATQALVDYSIWLNVEPAGAFLYDGFCAIASPVGGTDPNDYEGWCYHGSADGWASDYLDLANIYEDGTVDLTGDSSVWFAMIFFSDDTITYPGGAFVDNLIIRRCASNCNAILPESLDTASGVEGVPWHDAWVEQDKQK